MRTSDQLLDLDLRLPITSWHVDESLYSLCCRYHYISGNAVASRSARQLFGHAQQGTQHDFPSRINVFAQRTQSLFGTPEQIVRQRTVLPFFLPWKTQCEADQLVAMFCSGKTSKIKSLLGLPASRLRAHLPLKACPECIRNDRRNVGVAYWHLKHQLPGIWICEEHHCVLLESNQKTSGVGRFLWTLPHENNFYETRLEYLDSAAHTQLLLLAQLVYASFQLPQKTHLTAERLRHTYRHALGQRGLLRGQSHIAIAEATIEYKQFISALENVIPELQLASSASQSAQTLSRLLQPRTRLAHPLKHLLIILWLFKTWESFWSSYLESDQTTAPEQDISRTTVNLRRTEFLHYLQTHKLSITQAAKLIGITPHTGQVWASAIGIHINRRSKLARSTVKAIIKALQAGRDKAKIAQTHNVSISTITRILRTEPSLQQQWHLQRHTARQNDSRTIWMQAIETHPESTLKELRKCHSACYAWLYRNDRQWLIKSQATIPKHQRINQSNVDWQKRDTQLAATIEQVCIQLAAQDSVGKPISLQRIYQAAPALKPFLNKLDRLPLTKQVIDKARYRHSPNGRSTK